VLLLDVLLNPADFFLGLFSFALSLRSHNFSVLEVRLQLVVPLLQLINFFDFFGFDHTLLLL